MDVALSGPQAVQDAAEQTERALGGLDMLIHTLGGERTDRCVDLLDPGVQAVVWNGSPPLHAALTCSRGAMQFMARRQHGHILHLVTRADVGALEVERLVLKRLQQSWRQDGVPRSVTMSAVYFDEVAALLPAKTVENRAEPRLLEMYTGRLLEEDGWIGKVMIEREIGRLMQQICRGLGRGSRDPIQSFDFAYPFRPLADGGTTTLMAA